MRLWGSLRRDRFADRSSGRFLQGLPQQQAHQQVIHIALSVVSSQAQTLLYCTKCRAAVQMINCTGKEEQGILILRGACAACGQEVVRVLEEPEGKPSLN